MTPRLNSRNFVAPLVWEAMLRLRGKIPLKPRKEEEVMIYFRNIPTPFIFPARNVQKAIMVELWLDPQITVVDVEGNKKVIKLEKDRPEGMYI